MHSSELIKTLNYKLDADSNLPPQLIDDINDAMGLYVDSLLKIETKKEPGILAETVDFPDFVSELIQGTYDAVLNASIQQMDAYTDLVQEVAESVHQFMEELEQGGNARDHLIEEAEFDIFDALDTKTAMDVIDCEKLNRALNKLDIDLAIDCPPSEEQLEAVRDAFEVRSRQKLLATTVMMGINRIVVTDGTITGY